MKKTLLLSLLTLVLWTCLLMCACGRPEPADCTCDPCLCNSEDTVSWNRPDSTKITSEEFLEKVTKGMTREDVILTVGAPQEKIYTFMPVGEYYSQTIPAVCHYYYTSDGKTMRICYSFSDDMTVETVTYVLCS